MKEELSNNFIDYENKQENRDLKAKQEAKVGKRGVFSESISNLKEFFSPVRTFGLGILNEMGMFSTKEYEEKLAKGIKAEAPIKRTKKEKYEDLIEKLEASGANPAAISMLIGSTSKLVYKNDLENPHMGFQSHVEPVSAPTGESYYPEEIGFHDNHLNSDLNKYEMEDNKGLELTEAEKETIKEIRQDIGQGQNKNKIDSDGETLSPEELKLVAELRKESSQSMSKKQPDFPSIREKNKMF